MEINIESHIVQRIEEMDLGFYVREEVRVLISKDVRETIQKIIVEEARVMVTTEIDKIMDGPVETDDGWGKKNSYPSFADLFKKEVKAAFSASWDAKRLIEQKTKERVDALIKGEYGRIVEKVVDGLTCSKLVKKE